MSIRINTIESAPEDSRPTLQAAQEAMGSIPNLAGGMAESPTLIRGFFTLRKIYSEGTLTPQEIQVLAIVNARENSCTWCVAFHSRAAIAAGVPRDVVETVRSGGLPDERRLRALCHLSQELVRHRGHAPAGVLREFQAAGLTPAQSLEVVLGVGFSVLANYSQHLIKPPLDENLRPFAWTPERTTMAEEVALNS